VEAKASGFRTEDSSSLPPAARPPAMAGGPFDWGGAGGSATRSVFVLARFPLPCGACLGASVRPTRSPGTRPTRPAALRGRAFSFLGAPIDKLRADGSGS
jgi:hypothetical protein